MAAESDAEVFARLHARLARPYEVIGTLSALVGEAPAAITQGVGLALATSHEAQVLLDGMPVHRAQPGHLAAGPQRALHRRAPRPGDVERDHVGPGVELRRPRPLHLRHALPGLRHRREPGAGRRSAHRARRRTRRHRPRHRPPRGPRPAPGPQGRQRRRPLARPPVAVADLAGATQPPVAAPHPVGQAPQDLPARPRPARPGRRPDQRRGGLPLVPPDRAPAPPAAHGHRRPTRAGRPPPGARLPGRARGAARRADRLPPRPPRRRRALGRAARAAAARRGLRPRRSTGPRAEAELDGALRRPPHDARHRGRRHRPGPAAGGRDRQHRRRRRRCS